jgi:hypothetical protein
MRVCTPEYLRPDPLSDGDVYVSKGPPRSFPWIPLLSLCAPHSTFAAQHWCFGAYMCVYVHEFARIACSEHKHLWLCERTHAHAHLCMYMRFHAPARRQVF